MENSIQSKSMGALLNANDNRDVHIASVFPKREHPIANITDISMLPLEDQKDKGTCVGQAEGKGEEYRDFLETGKVTRLSKRFIYTQAKKRDGFPGEGTSPRVAAQVLLEMGVPREDLVGDNNDLPYPEYLQLDVSDEILNDAGTRKVAGYAFCLTLDDVKTAIDVAGVLNATVMVGAWEGTPLRPTPRTGLHRVLIFGYQEGENEGKPDTKIYFRNSWGQNWLDGGDGWFWWNEYESSLFDMMVYTDLPKAVLEVAHETVYQFTRVLHIGMRGTDVMELQKRLSKEIAFDGKPCYTYQENGKPYFGIYFGMNTEAGVKRYQKTKALVSTGDWKTTGYGQLGPNTIIELNKSVIPVVPTSKLPLMAEAIKVHEGWYPGSRSYRNNNPGNIRYVGQARAIGGDAGGYCIFKTYNDGMAALMELLTNAATGKSHVYSPEMSILDFFMKYAPAADSNSPETYAAFVAKKVGLPVTTPIKYLV